MSEYGGWIRIGQQQMRYDEQQINNSLKCLEEQDQLSNYHYEMGRSNQLLQLRLKDSDISQWDNPKQYRSQSKKKSQFPYLKANKYDQQRYTSFLDIINEPHEDNFFQYDKLPHYRIQKSSEKVVSPKRIDLQLPLPHLAREQSEYPKIYQSQASLPLIKKIALPVKLLRKDERARLKREEVPLQDLSGLLGIGSSESIATRHSKVLSSTRRQIKSFQSYTERPAKVLIDDTRLKQCITFIK